MAHKIRNTAHKDLLERVSSQSYTDDWGIVRDPLSKRKSRELLTICNWDEEKFYRLLKSGDWVYHFVDD